MNSQKVTAYLSHTIRGSKGIDSTEEDKQRNCKKAIEVVNWIRYHIPDLDIYAPAEHEYPPVGILLQKGYITVEQILEVDCMIVGERDLLIVLVEDSWVGGGIGIEMKHAKNCGKPIFKIKERDELTLELLRNMVREIIERKEKGQ